MLAAKILIIVVSINLAILLFELALNVVGVALL